MSRRGKFSRGRRTYRIATKAAKRVLMKKAETKHILFGRENYQVNHNAQISALNTQPLSEANFFNCWRSILPGTGVDQRIGNEVTPRGMSLRLYGENTVNRPNVHHRLIIGTYPRINVNGTQMSHNNMISLDDTGQGSNLLRHKIDDRNVKILYDRVIKNEIGYSDTGAGGARVHFFKKIWIKRKRASNIVFSDSTVNAVIMNKPVFLMLIPYDSYNTLITDTIATYSYQCKLYFKDV